MKAAIYIEDGITQLVLTPQNDWEKSITKDMEKSFASPSVMIKRNEFYKTQGGFVSQGYADRNYSLMIVITEDSDTVAS